MPSGISLLCVLFTELRGIHAFIYNHYAYVYPMHRHNLCIVLNYA